MSEILHNKTTFSLLEITKRLQAVVQNQFSNSYWIKAELHCLNYYQQSGHCYPELVEKQNGKVVAKIKGTIWNSDYININNKFRRVLNESLRDGIKILFLARITYDPVFGLSLKIIDIDPTYTLGDLEVERQETIRKLKEEGLYSRNKSLQLSLLPKRIAIISDRTSKGYSDFVNVLENNAGQFKFIYRLFPANLQGERAIETISMQLELIKEELQAFDVVAIVRGGGDDTSLACYNNYSLTKAIARFPIPVVTGIGHSTNETVVEAISHFNAITPSKLADYLIQIFQTFSLQVKQAQEKISTFSKRMIEGSQSQIFAEARFFKSAVRNILQSNKNRVANYERGIQQSGRALLKNEKLRLHSLQKQTSQIITSFLNVSEKQIRDIAKSLGKDVRSSLNANRLIIVQRMQSLAIGAHVLARAEKREISLLKNRIFERSFWSVKYCQDRLNNIEKNIDNMSPQKVLQRGYSITLFKGKAITKASEVKQGDVLNTVVSEGEILTTVK